MAPTTINKGPIARPVLCLVDFCARSEYGEATNGGEMDEEDGGGGLAPDKPACTFVCRVGDNPTGGVFLGRS